MCYINLLPGNLATVIVIQLRISVSMIALGNLFNFNHISLLNGFNIGYSWWSHDIGGHKVVIMMKNCKFKLVTNMVLPLVHHDFS